MYLLSSRFNMLAKTRQTWKLDGMNTLEYETISREYLPLYTNITIDIGTAEGLHPPVAPPPVKTAASEADVQMKSSANHKDDHWGQFTRCFPSYQCGVLALEPVSRACIHCGSACLSRLKTVDLNSTSPCWSRSTLIPATSMIYSSMDGAGEVGLCEFIYLQRCCHWWNLVMP